MMVYLGRHHTAAYWNHSNQTIMSVFPGNYSLARDFQKDFLDGLMKYDMMLCCGFDV